MTLKLRFAILLGALLAGFVGALLLLQHVERAEREDALENLRQERAATLELWLELSGQNLQQFVNDYSLWDETVRFVDKPSLEWARINLTPSLTTFNVAALWVLDARGAVVHQEAAKQFGTLDLPLGPSDFSEVTEQDRFAWFFVATSIGLIELRVAPIQPSDDAGRTHPPAGWLVAGRRWDQPLLERLGRFTESRASLRPPGGAVIPSATTGATEVVRPLRDWRGQAVQVLHVVRETPELSRRLQANATAVQIFVSFGLLSIVLLSVALHLWVLRPLGTIEACLAEGKLTAIARLQTQQNELGRLALLAETSFSQRDALQREVEERRKAEDALRRSETSLRHAIEERVKLGRDLHDSIIQSVYASGLGLTAVKNLLRSDATEAERRLEQVRRRLNDTIRDLRNFITGLEPEAIRQLSMKDAILALVDFVQTAAPLKVDVQVDEAVAERIATGARANLLQITRESLSNVLRHAGARSVKVMLTGDDHHGDLLVQDDGRGFALDQVGEQGRGLRNIRERAIASSALLEVDSTPGKGTRLRVRFPLIRSSA